MTCVSLTALSEPVILEPKMMGRIGEVSLILVVSLGLTLLLVFALPAVAEK